MFAKIPIKAFSAILLLLLSGCQAYTAVRQDTTPADATAANTAATPKEEATKAPPPTVIKPFTQEGLYQLLVAEMAGMRGDLELAMRNYVQQAQETRDIGIISRAMRIATYMNDFAAQQNMAALWVEVEPDNLEPRHTLALGLARKGLLIEALPHAVFCLTQDDPDPLFTLTVLANSSNQKARQALLDHYPTLEQQYPERPEIFLSKAMLLRQQGLPERALESAQHSLELNADSETAHLLVAQLLHHQGKKAQALTQLHDAIELLPDSKRLRVQLIRFVAAEDLGKAKALLEELTEEFPGDADLGLTLAAVNKELGLHAEAKALYLSLLDNRSATVSAHFQLGLIAEEEGNLEEALTHYRQVRTGANLIPAAVRLSHLLAQHGQFDTARLYLSKLRTEIPEQAARLFQVESELLIQHEKNQDAFQVLSNALDFFPDNISLLYTRSMVGDQLKDHAQAERDLRAILAVDQNNAMALNALGYTLTLHSNRYEEAHQLILRALEINPDDPATLDSLGWVLYHMGEYEEALLHLRKAFASLPDPEVAAHLGEVLWVIGDKEEAQRVWNETLSENPNSSIILDTIKRLNEVE